MERLVNAFEDFELNTGLLLAAWLIAMKNGSCLIKVLNLTDAPMTVCRSTKAKSYLRNKQK